MDKIKTIVIAALFAAGVYVICRLVLLTNPNNLFVETIASMITIMWIMIKQIVLGIGKLLFGL